jgi:hypothetical protein
VRPWTDLAGYGANGDADSGPPLVLAFTAAVTHTEGLYSSLVTATFGLSEVSTGPTAPVGVAVPVLYLVKTTPFSVEQGGVLIYTLVFSNGGTPTAVGPVLSDTATRRARFYVDKRGGSPCPPARPGTTRPPTADRN